MGLNHLKPCLYHPLGVSALGHKPLYSQGFLRFSVFYIGIRVNTIIPNMEKSEFFLEIFMLEWEDVKTL
jgi:hypothetical protein